ncbi:MAG: hypothetical protein HYZ11_09340 [Candidatus Tectomicrobia bacterium]|uniref:Uncharacterized protein n=1 Tax=Tectimicrobiota bacterium TaxID=2528274 RepID=A0A932MM17_UNCTE|nr:hypothetical protein [Candidatus Tectomicrobia bacterium]
MDKDDEMRRPKLEALHEELARGEASGIAEGFSMDRLLEELDKGAQDLANGRMIVLKDDKVLRKFFARLKRNSSDCDPRR